MSSLMKRIRLGKRGIVTLVIVVIVVTWVALTTGSNTKTVTAYFDQAISVYPGTDVDILGVVVGKVDSVEPEGQQVAVKISYDADYSLASTVRAAVITPTLVADRFIQFAPRTQNDPLFAQGSDALQDGGKIPLFYTDGKRRNAVPIEMDQIYRSIAALTSTLGPNGANKTGALSQLLSSSAKALKGNGALGHDTLVNLSKASTALGSNADQIFGTIDNLAQLTATLQANDKLVGDFMDSLGTVSQQLAGESDDLKQALAAIANAVATVQTFVHDNRAMLKKDIQELTTTVGVLSKQSKTLGEVLQFSALGLGNLTDAYDPVTGTIGIRAQLGPAGSSLGSVLCGVLQANGKLPAAQLQPVCDLLKIVLNKSTNNGAGIPTGTGAAKATTPGSTGPGQLLQFTTPGGGQ